jgi:transcriptional regulator with XRE-family HTH domain
MPTPLHLTIAARIKSRREALGLNQSALANAAGVSRSAATQWELGLTSPSFEKTVLLSELLECSPEWLAFGSKPVEQANGNQHLQLPNVTHGGAHRDGPKSFSLDADFIASFLGSCESFEHLATATVEKNDFAPHFIAGDRLLVRTQGWVLGLDGFYLINGSKSHRLVQIRYFGSEEALLTFAVNCGPVTQKLALGDFKIVAHVCALLGRSRLI